MSVLVPVVLCNYLAARAADVARSLRPIAAAVGSGSTVPLSAGADVHAGLAPCPWQAIAVVSMAEGCIEAAIAAKDWTISARRDATEFTYSYVVETAIGMAGRPLRSVVDLSILPAELIIRTVDVSPSGQGTFFCDGFNRPLGRRPNSDFERLSDVQGRVSGSRRPR